MENKIEKLKEIYSDFVDKEAPGGEMDEEDAINIGFYMENLNEILQEINIKLEIIKKKN